MAPQFELPNAQTDASLMELNRKTPQPISNQRQSELDLLLSGPSQVKGDVPTHGFANSPQPPVTERDTSVPSPTAEPSSGLLPNSLTMLRATKSKPSDLNPIIVSTNAGIPSPNLPPGDVERPPVTLTIVKPSRQVEEQQETITRREKALEIFGRVEWMQIQKGTIEEVESFPTVDNAETKYQEFKSVILQRGRTLGFPHGCKTYDRVLLRHQDSNSGPSPYIRFTGFLSRNTVKKFHAVLSKSSLTKVYSPPLRVCYEIRRLRYLAGPSQAIPIQAPAKDSLCGSLVSIGEPENARNVTIGGILKAGGRYSIITAGHHIKDDDDDDESVDESSWESFFEDSFNPDDYGDDIYSPLILEYAADELTVDDLADDPRLHGPFQSLDSGLKSSEESIKFPASVHPVAQPFASISMPALGVTQLSGFDWSLSPINSPRLTLPNCFCLKDSSKQIYLTRQMDRLRTGRVWLLAGVTGKQLVTITPNETQLPLPSGNWITAWKVRVDHGTLLKPGDSGSWVVSSEGEVLGHVIAQSGDCVYIMPFKDVLLDITARHESLRPVELPSPLDILIDLSRWEPDWSSRYASHSWAFEVVRFLLDKPQSIQSGIISILTYVMMKSGWDSDMLSCLTAMWQKETIDSLQRLSGITIPSVACDVIKELIQLSQICGVEPPRLFVDGTYRLRERSVLELAEGLHSLGSILAGDFNDEIKRSTIKATLRPTWFLAVDRQSMAEWFRRRDDLRQKQQGDVLPTLRVGTHVITAYYNEVPQILAETHDFLSRQDYMTAHDTHIGSTLPLRLVIESETLIRELQRISKVPLQQRPLALIPPYKLLVHYWDTIQATLQTLKKQRDLRQDLKSSDYEEDDIIMRIDHLQCLHDFVQTDLAHLIGLRIKAGEATLEYISFDELYYLFSPGDLIVGRDTGEDQLYQVYAVTGGRMRLKSSKSSFDSSQRVKADDSSRGRVGTFTNLRLACYILAWDGNRIGPIQITHEIQHFVSRRRVTDLGAYPLRFLAKYSKIQEALQFRGREVLQCSGHMKYAGPSYQALSPADVFMEGTQSKDHDNPIISWDQNSKRVASNEAPQSVNSEVYIDGEACHHFTFEMDNLISSLPRPLGDNQETTESIVGQDNHTFASGDHDIDAFLADQFMLESLPKLDAPDAMDNLVENGPCLQLLSFYVPGYEFRSRSWIWLNVHYVQPIDKSHQARRSGWNELVMRIDYKRLLVSLVHDLSDTDLKIPVDPVGGKDSGINVLLHGGPGTGKTFTAESLAAHTGRPLYSITCGDVGVNPTEVERTLNKHRRLAERWRCILLLEDADVFGEARNARELERNALISVFLRFLDHHSGIVFLTTSVVGTFDAAFHSHLHLSLYYPPMSLRSTIKIWENSLQRIQRDNALGGIKVKFDKGKLLKFAKRLYRAQQEASNSTWNGRQIRNAFQTVITQKHNARLKRSRHVGSNSEPQTNTEEINLSVNSFKSIAKASLDLDSYLAETMADEDFVHRLDHFNPPLRDLRAGRQHNRDRLESLPVYRGKSLRLDPPSQTGLFDRTRKSTRMQRVATLEEDSSEYDSLGEGYSSHGKIEKARSDSHSSDDLDG